MRILVPPASTEVGAIFSSKSIITTRYRMLATLAVSESCGWQQRCGAYMEALRALTMLSYCNRAQTTPAACVASDRNSFLCSPHDAPAPRALVRANSRKLKLRNHKYINIPSRRRVPNYVGQRLRLVCRSRFLTLALCVLCTGTCT
jgi:hypothetical protein